MNVLYIPRTSLTQPDLLFGEDPTKSFTGAYTMAVYLETVDGFEGPGTMFTKFNYEIKKETRLLLSNLEFTSVTQQDLGPRPREGDLIWFHTFQAIHEITFVDQDKFFYAFGSIPFYGWTLVTEAFRYNNEIINTGYKEVDTKVNEVVTAYSANVTANLNTAISFAVSEMVYQGANLNTATVTANVVTFNRPSGTLILKDIQGDFVWNANVIGVETSANWILNSIDTGDDINRPLGNNAFLRNEANNILDFSESNPFGNPITNANEQ